MSRRLLPILAVLTLVLAACRTSGGAADPLRTARQHIEASRCVGVDRYAQAVAELEAVLRAQPDRLEAYYWLYVARRAQGNSAEADQALKSLEEAVAAGRGGPEGLFWLYQTYRHKGDTAAADRTLGVLEATARSLPADAGAQFWLGRAYAEGGRSEEALQFFQKTLALDSRHALAHFWAGQMYAGREEWEAALAEFDAALKADPENAAAYHNRGAVHYRLGDLERAEADFQAALKREPEDPRSHYQLGAVYLARSLPANPLALPDSALLEKARAEFEAALAACPGMPEALIGMGNFYLLQGDAQKALDVLNQVLAQEPKSLQAWYAVAQAQAMLGNVQEACDALARFISLSPPPDWEEQAEKIRAQLRCP